MLNALIANFQRISSVTREHKFGRQWGPAAKPGKDSDPEQYRFDVGGDANPAKKLRKDIIANFERRVDGLVSNFVDELLIKSESFATEQRHLRVKQMERVAAFNESVVHVVDRIYTLLDACAQELNCRLSCSEMTFSSTAPKHVTEVLRFSKARQALETITYYRARVASPSVSLIIRGREDTIDVFMLPVERVLGLSKIENGHEPVLQLMAYLEDDQVVWTHNLEPLTASQEQLLCLRLFERLLDTTKTHIQAAEPIAPKQVPWANKVG